MRISPLLLPLFAGFAGAQSPSKDTAVGVFPFLVGNMDGQIGTIVNDARTRDLDTIYVSAFRTSGIRQGELWITDRAGNWDPRWGQVRPTGAGIDLRALIGQAHTAGLQVVAVIKCFDTAVPPTDASHRAYLLDVIRYLLRNYDGSGNPVYDLDGIALDYVRWVGGGTVDPQVITDFVRDVKGVCGALSVHAYLIAGRYDFDYPYGGTFRPYSQVISTLANGFGQHWEQMARHVDVMMPMAYTADGSIYNTFAAHQAYVQTVAAYCRTACARGGFPFRRVTPVIRTWTDGSETCTAQTVAASASGALLGGAHGYQAFRYNTMRPHPDWWAEMQRYAVAGQNRPIPSLGHALAGLTAQLDASGSRDPDGSPGGLTVRFDLDNDGSWDTGELPINQAYAWLLARPAATRDVGVEVRDGDGLVGATTRRVSSPLRVLTLSSRTISASAGGAVDIDLEPGPAALLHTYVVLGGISGAVPGTPLAPGFVLPVNYDGVTSALIASLNTPIFAGSLGTVGSSGRMRATFAMPPGILNGLLLRTFTFAAFGVAPGGAPSFVTDAAELAVVF